MEGVIGYVTMFAGNFAPKSWAFCNGQIINIASNTALFSILGTTYGGNGTTTFGLPNLQGRAIVGTGTGPGLSTYSLGQVGGSETDTLNAMQMPAHVHPVAITAHNGATTDDANVATPASNYYGRDSNGISPFASAPGVNMASYNAQIQMSNMGNSQAFSILRPLMGMNYVICQYGVFPARN